MPTITVLKSDLDALLGDSVPLGALETELELAKAELKGHDPSTGELKIELNDTNRPDLWSAPGLARQLAAKRAGHTRRHAFFDSPKTPPEHQVVVDGGLRRIRPCLAACVARGYRLDDAGVRALIQSQEKLADNFGRRRRAVAIGVYRADKISFPVRYEAADPDAARFTPLEFDEPMSLRAILEVHPKGREFGHLLAGAPRFPLLIDDARQVLSMPPIINSAHLGQVEPGDSELFIEVTGPDLRQLILAINIAAADLADRGAEILPVAIEYPYDTPFGQTVVTPHDFSASTTVDLGELKRMLGEPLADDEIADLLRGMGHQAVEVAGGAVTVVPPPFRDDLLHAVDVIEDVCVSRNLNRFEPILPSDFTVGKLSDVEECCRVVRDHLIGAGFQEMVSGILTSHEAVYHRMRLEDNGSFLEVDNVMSASYAVLRASAIPSLMAVEAVSGKTMYPHRIFELGEVVKRAPKALLGSSTHVVATALLAHPEATVSELGSTLDALMYYMHCDYSVEATEHPSFLDGRAGAVVAGGRAVGILGEIHPEALERWGIAVPVSVFEVDLGVFVPTPASS